MIAPLILAAMAVSDPVGATGRTTCKPVASWQRAGEQKPPVPWSEPIKSAAVLISKAKWLWNGRTVSEADFMLYLRNIRYLNPAPLNLFAFASELTCSEKRALQTRIADAVACPIDGKSCLEGTVAEYRAARGLK